MINLQPKSAKEKIFLYICNVEIRLLVENAENRIY